MCFANKATKLIKQTPVFILRRIFSPSLTGKGLTRGTTSKEAKHTFPPQLVQCLRSHINDRGLDKLRLQVVLIWILAAVLKIDARNNLDTCLLQTQRQPACPAEQIDRANVRHSAPF